MKKVLAILVVILFFVMPLVACSNNQKIVGEELFHNEEKNSPIICQAFEFSEIPDAEVLEKRETEGILEFNSENVKLTLKNDEWSRGLKVSEDVVVSNNDEEIFLEFKGYGTYEVSFPNEIFLSKEGKLEEQESLDGYKLESLTIRLVDTESKRT